MKRFYYEQDGDAPKNSSANAHYVIDSFADPFSDQYRTDIPHDTGAAMAREGRRLAAEFNAQPPWPVWDTIAAENAGYVSPATSEQFPTPLTKK